MKNFQNCPITLHHSYPGRGQGSTYVRKVRYGRPRVHRYVNRFEDSNSFVLNVILFDTGKLRLLSLILCIVFVHCHGTMSPDMPCLSGPNPGQVPLGGLLTQTLWWWRWAKFAAISPHHKSARALRHSFSQPCFISFHGHICTYKATHSIFFIKRDSMQNLT